MNLINRIILVGNGFDLAHNLRTSYKDFINWYWDKCLYELRRFNKYTYSDGLCTFKINDSDRHYTWLSFISAICPLNPSSGREFFIWLKNDYRYKYLVSIDYSSLMKRILNSIESKAWVDIENEYFSALNVEYSVISKNQNKELQINKELQKLRSYLIEYLSCIQKQVITKSIIKDELQNKFLASILGDEIAISSSNKLIDILGEKYIKKENDKIILKKKLCPSRIMLLNFNYTETADRYIQLLPDWDNKCKINHIHGNLEDPDSIIFGYGDELDDRYKELEKANNNYYLDNIKSIKYLESNNYREMLTFIDSAPYQVYIMGHSCGNSDRTLLNTLFEHDNCISIKPFYHKKEDGSDNYLELIQNISRNFTDMKLFRDRVVNKKFCEPLL